MNENQLPHPNSYRVAPGLLAGEYPGASQHDEALVKLTRHLQAGITSFVDLTEAGELVPYEPLLTEAVQIAGKTMTITYQRFPIRDGQIPSSPSMMVAILDAIDAALAARQTVYVHCWGGVGRTGTVVGCWLVRHGRTGEAALAELNAHWQHVEKRSRYPYSPETGRQHAYVRAWHE
ncbi:MAG: phosphatase [Chloroflexaceae bacterium]|nr:phosphatase [Chloroflexaceae bacterium]